MSQKIPPPTPEINRLRAAAALIPIIESGLLESKLSVERAALMASFCEWTTEHVPDDPEAVKLAVTVGSGLKRIKMALLPVA
ncbi:MAG: hypothetical protein V5B32_13790 [Candidatus Accumulibacter sp. UW26]|jgi:hypothetical protein